MREAVTIIPKYQLDRKSTLRSPLIGRNEALKAMDEEASNTHMSGLAVAIEQMCRCALTEC